MSDIPLKPATNSTSSDRKSVPAAMQAFMRGLRLMWNQCLPAQVVEYDRVNNVATVQPMISWVLTDDTSKQRQQLVQIPVMSLGGGGFHINFPLKPGDLGWIYATDRDLSLFKQSLQISTPPTSRMHDFSDSMFIPDVFRQYTIAGEDSASMVIQSTDGSTKISISEGSILIAATSKVTVRVPTTEFTGDVNIDGNMSVAKNATVTGQTQVNGGFAAAGGQACTLPATTTVDGKMVDGHQHGGVQSGGSNTNPF